MKKPTEFLSSHMAVNSKRDVSIGVSTITGTTNGSYLISGFDTSKNINANVVCDALEIAFQDNQGLAVIPNGILVEDLLAICEHKLTTQLNEKDCLNTRQTLDLIKKALLKIHTSAKRENEERSEREESGRMARARHSPFMDELPFGVSK